MRNLLFSILFLFTATLSHAADVTTLGNSLDVLQNDLKATKQVVVLQARTSNREDLMGVAYLIDQTIDSVSVFKDSVKMFKLEDVGVSDQMDNLEFAHTLARRLEHVEQFKVVFKQYQLMEKNLSIALKALAEVMPPPNQTSERSL